MKKRDGTRSDNRDGMKRDVEERDGMKCDVDIEDGQDVKKKKKKKHKDKQYVFLSCSHVM